MSRLYIHFIVPPHRVQYYSFLLTDNEEDEHEGCLTSVTLETPLKSLLNDNLDSEISDRSSNSFPEIIEDTQSADSRDMDMDSLQYSPEHRTSNPNVDPARYKDVWTEDSVSISNETGTEQNSVLYGAAMNSHSPALNSENGKSVQNSKHCKVQKQSQNNEDVTHVLTKSTITVDNSISGMLSEENGLKRKDSSAGEFLCAEMHSNLIFSLLPKVM